MSGMRISTSGASSRDSAEIAKHSRGTPGRQALANHDELTMLVMTLQSAFGKRSWLR